MTKYEINEIIQEDLSYYADILIKLREKLKDYQKSMGNQLDNLYKTSDEYYNYLLDTGLSEKDASYETGEVFDSSFETIYSRESEILADIKFAEIKLKIAQIAYANIKYLSDDSEV